MNLITHRHAQLPVDGAQFLGELDALYEELRWIFGDPIQIKDFGSKSDVMWHIGLVQQNRLMAVATIHNWKDGPNYGYPENPPETINRWRVGGFGAQTYHMVLKMLAEHRDQMTKQLELPL